MILGAGMIGSHLAREMIDEKRDVVMVEKDAELARVAANELDCLVLHEDGTRPEALKKAGVDSASWFLALTGSDEVNIVSCGIASSMREGLRTVARAENPFYSALSRAQRDALGLDVILNPDLEVADNVARIMESGFAEDVVPLHEGKLQLRRVMAPAAFIGRQLSEIKTVAARSFLVGAVVSGGRFEIPSGETIVKEGDFVYLLGSPGDLDAVIGPVAELGISARKVLIVGATGPAERLIERLMERRKAGQRGLSRILGRRLSLGLIESSRELAKLIGRAFPDVAVTQADSSEEGVLEACGIAKTDLFVAATPSQTFNIMTAHVAKNLGASKSIAIAMNERYSAFSSGFDVDALVNVKNATAASVLELIRKAHIRTIHSFFEDDVEIVELTVGRDSPAAGKAIKDLGLNRGILVAFAIREGKITVPSGGTVVSGRDTLGFIVRKSAIGRIEEAFGSDGGR